jgi:hypothetical protein
MDKLIRIEKVDVIGLECKGDESTANYVVMGSGIYTICKVKLSEVVKGQNDRVEWNETYHGQREFKVEDWIDFLRKRTISLKEISNGMWSK